MIVRVVVYQSFDGNVRLSRNVGVRKCSSLIIGVKILENICLLE